MTKSEHSFRLQSLQANVRLHSRGSLSARPYSNTDPLQINPDSGYRLQSNRVGRSHLHDPAGELD